MKLFLLLLKYFEVRGFNCSKGNRHLNSEKGGSIEPLEPPLGTGLIVEGMHRLSVQFNSASQIVPYMFFRGGDGV